MAVLLAVVVVEEEHSGDKGGVKMESSSEDVILLWRCGNENGGRIRCRLLVLVVISGACSGMVVRGIITKAEEVAASVDTDIVMVKREEMDKFFLPPAQLHGFIILILFG